MEYIRIQGGIPAVVYDSVEECLWDRSPETRKYLRSFKQPQSHYNGNFIFIMKLKKSNTVITFNYDDMGLRYSVFEYDKNGRVVSENDEDLLKYAKKNTRITKVIDIIDAKGDELQRINSTEFHEIKNILLKSSKKRKAIAPVCSNSYLQKLEVNLLKDKDFNLYYFVENQSTVNSKNISKLEKYPQYIPKSGGQTNEKKAEV